MAKNVAQDSRLEKDAILELLKIARIMKRQLKVLKGMQLYPDEKALIKAAIKSVEDDCSLFKIE